MKNHLNLLFLFLIAGASYAQEKKTETLSAFEWLAGTWERLDMKPGETGFETWYLISNEYYGKGVTLKNGDTTFVEELRLITKDNKTYYVANVSHNEAAVYFEITRSARNGFICENPQHDFPKKIEYIYMGDKLKVEISGNGKSGVFNFQKSQIKPGKL